MPPLIRKQFHRFKNALRILRTISAQTAVHRKKIEYCLDQFQFFLESIIPTLDQSECTPEEIDINDRIISTLTALRGVFTQYIIQNWIEPTITNPSDLILLQLQTQFSDLQKLFSHYNEPLSHIFDIDEKKWIELHLIDLSAIYSSFKQYSKQKTNSDQFDSIVQERMNEIEDYIQEHNTNLSEGELLSPLPKKYKKWKVDYKDFSIIEKIGSGLSAEVYLALDKRTNKYVAIKQFKEANLSGARLQLYQREIAVLSLLAEKQEPFFIKFIGATDTYPICIITKYMPNGSLRQKLRKGKNITPLFKTITAYDIARGMATLHSLSIIHRDLKSLNILLDKTDRSKICDFGFSRSISEFGYKMLPIGTIHWMAPEILSGVGIYTFKVDVYAYAMVLCELVNITKPFNNVPNDKVKDLVLHSDARPDLPLDLNPELRKLIVQCWDKDPDVRPSFAEIVRRFESMNLAFDGTDMVEFANHIKQLNKSIPIDSKKLRANMLKTGVLPLREIIDDLSRNGMQETEVDDLWDALSTLIEKHDDKAKLSIFISYFFHTKKLFDAVTILRSFPRRSVPMKVIENLIHYYPSTKRNQRQINLTNNTHNSFNNQQSNNSNEHTHSVNQHSNNTLIPNTSNSNNNSTVNNNFNNQQSTVSSNAEQLINLNDNNTSHIDNNDQSDLNDQNNSEIQQSNLSSANHQSFNNDNDQQTNNGNNYDSSNRENTILNVDIESQLDTAICVLCCRNDGAALILENAINEKDIALAFEVIAAEEESLEMKDKVSTILYNKLNEQTTSSLSDQIIISAMRCALVLKIPDKIPLDKVIYSENPLIRHHAYASAMGIGLQGKQINQMILQQIFKCSFHNQNEAENGHKIIVEREAQGALIAACTSSENAKLILSLIVNNNFCDIFSTSNSTEAFVVEERETIIKVLMVCAKHKELHTQLKLVLEQNPFVSLPEYEKQINNLKSRLNV